MKALLYLPGLTLPDDWVTGEVTLASSYAEVGTLLETQTYALAVLGSHGGNEHLAHWARHLKAAALDTKLFVSFTAADYDEKRLRGLLSQGVDSYIIGAPSRQTIELLYNKLSGTVYVVTRSYGRVTLERNKLYVSGKSFHCSTQEVHILQMLIAARGLAVSRKQLLRALGYKLNVKTRAAVAHVGRLRNRFAAEGIGGLIIADGSRLGGYRFALD